MLASLKADAMDTNRWFIVEFLSAGDPIDAGDHGEPVIRPSSIRTDDSICANHVDMLTVRSVVPHVPFNTHKHNTSQTAVAVSLYSANASRSLHPEVNTLPYEENCSSIVDLA